MGNPFCYVEFHSRDRERFVAFYGQLFDWAIAQSQPGYSEIRTGVQPSGGLTSAADDMQPGILVYVQVDDILETVTRAQGLGGRQIQPMTDIPGYGHFAVIEDPDGNKLGLFTPVGGVVRADAAHGDQTGIHSHAHAHDGHEHDHAHTHAGDHSHDHDHHDHEHHEHHEHDGHDHAGHDHADHDGHADHADHDVHRGPPTLRMPAITPATVAAAAQATAKKGRAKPAAKPAARSTAAKPAAAKSAGKAGAAKPKARTTKAKRGR